MGFTAEACKLDPLSDKFVAFNFDVYEVQDGNNEEEILKIIQNTEDSINPVAIICNTIKGRGVSFMEGNNVWHYRPPTGDEYLKAIEELSGHKT